MNTKDIVKQLVANTSKVSSVAELERKLEIANGTINRWDKSQPTIKVLEKLSDFFDVSIDYLLGRTSNPNGSNKKYSSDLEEILDGMMSFDGKPINDHDREVIRAYLEGKFADK